MSEHTPMVVAAARAFCKLSSEACHVDNDDNWKVDGELFLEAAQAAIDASGAPELLEALCALVLNIDAGGATLNALRDARAAIAKATGEQSLTTGETT